MSFGGTRHRTKRSSAASFGIKDSHKAVDFCRRLFYTKYRPNGSILFGGGKPMPIRVPNALPAVSVLEQENIFIMR